jgi:hypothetical protein
MSGEHANEARQCLDAAYENPLEFSHYIQTAQVNATLAVAEELSRLVRVLQERSR